MLRPFATLAALTLAATATPSLADEKSYLAEYQVTLRGLPVASARFESTFSEDGFHVAGRLSSTGIAKLFDRTRANAKVAGSLDAAGVRPRTFTNRYSSGGKKGSTVIKYRDGAVHSAVNEPETRRGKNWVPVPAGELTGVFDPISSTLIRASGPDEICNRTIRFFDGELRGDLRLSHRGQQRVEGFKEPAIACNARFVPVGGYRKGRKQIEYMQEKSRITIAFARLGDTGFYTPVDTSIGTQAGTLRITAKRIRAR